MLLLLPLLLLLPPPLGHEMQRTASERASERRQEERSLRHRVFTQRVSAAGDDKIWRSFFLYPCWLHTYDEHISYSWRFRDGEVCFVRDSERATERERV